MGNFATGFVTVIHVLLCVFMIFVILLQPGKDAGMGAAFGGGAATSAFGGRGAVTFLSKLTAACAVLFFVTSLGLSFAGLHRSVAAGAVPPPPPALADGGSAGLAPGANGTVQKTAEPPSDEETGEEEPGTDPQPAPSPAPTK
jgi:preprotein translocase subunit SecG